MIAAQNDCYEAVTELGKSLKNYAGRTQYTSDDIKVIANAVCKSGHCSSLSGDEQMTINALNRVYYDIQKNHRNNIVLLTVSATSLVLFTAITVLAVKNPQSITLLGAIGAYGIE